MRRREALVRMGGVGAFGAWIHRGGTAQGQPPDPTREHTEPGATRIRTLSQPIDGKEAVIEDVAFSPDGARLATAGRGLNFNHRIPDEFIVDLDRPFRVNQPYPNLTLTVWEIATGRAIWTVSGHQAPIVAVAFSPDGTRVVSGGVREYRPDFNLEAVHRMRAKARKEGKPLLFSNRGRGLPTIPSGGLIKVWTADTGRELLAITGPAGPVVALTVRRRITALDADYRLSIYEVDDGREFLTLDALQGDGQWMGGGQDTGKVAMSADGTRVIAISDTDEDRRNVARTGRILKLWDAPAVRCRNQPTHERFLSTVALSPDGHRIAALHGYLLSIRDFGNFRTLRGFRVPMDEVTTFLAFSPDGERIVTVSTQGLLRLWEVASSRLLRTIEGPRDRVRAVIFLPGRLRVAIGGCLSHEPTPLTVWDADLT